MAEGAITLRQFRPEDIADIIAIEQESFPDPWTQEMLEDWLTRRRCKAIIAECDKVPVGFIISLYGAKRIDIIDIAVVPAMRKRGIARLLLEEMIKHPGCELVSLEVRQSNIPAQMAYLKFGFIVTNIVRHFYEDDEPALRMQYIHSRFRT